MSKALVVLSGGQDSATCAAWSRVSFDEVEFLTFDYGQRHRREIESAIAIAAALGGRHRVLSVDALRGNPYSGLTSTLDVKEADAKTGLPKSFVPGRNLIFLTSAASLALSVGIHDVVTGVCQTDYSGYPDCRRDTIDALERAINLGNAPMGPVRIHTPLMFLTKAETVRLAERLPRGREMVGLSWTCYEGGARPCGECPACVLRVKGFAEAGIPDPAQK